MGQAKKSGALGCSGCVFGAVYEYRVGIIQGLARSARGIRDSLFVLRSKLPLLRADLLVLAHRPSFGGRIWVRFWGVVRVVG